MRPPEQPRIVAGKYELEKMLGQGGMGEVWVAKEIPTGNKIALKLLKTAAADSKENRGRFEREAHIAKTLQSPHIAQVTDSGVDEDGDPFMALELLHGEDLQKRIKTQKMLTVAQVVRLAIQVGRALHVAHSAGLVHRDLKPANIFLARIGEDEVVKVLDFGIAKTGALDNTQYTAAGAMLGTASYMSPEQIRNAKTVDHRADLWAFAVVLFRALTGEFPFELSGFELFLALAQDPIPTPQKVTSFVADLPGPLNIFFERSFVRELDKRYPTASAMVVGFCRAAGVTVPPDVLYAADAPMPTAALSGGAPTPGSSTSNSGQYNLGPLSAGSHNPSPSSGPHSGSPISAAPHSPLPGSGPHSGSPISGGPHSPSPISGMGGTQAPSSPHSPRPPPRPVSQTWNNPPTQDDGAGLSGTLMLDAMPGEAQPSDLHNRPLPAAGRALENGPPARPPGPPPRPNRPSGIATTQPMVDVPLDPEEPDNAATLFYQPPAKGSAPNESTPSSGPGFPSPSQKPAVFTYPLDAARAAAAGAELAAGGQLSNQVPTQQGNHLSHASHAAQGEAARQTGSHPAPVWANAPAPNTPAKRPRTMLFLLIGVVLFLISFTVIFLFFFEQ